MARCRKSRRVYGNVVFLGCCAFAKIDRHANESNARPLLSPSLFPLPGHPMESLSSSSAAHLERYSPRWTDTVPPPVAPHAFLLRPASRVMFICLFGVHDTQASSDNCCRPPRTTRRNAACLPIQRRCSRVCWTLPPGKIVIRLHRTSLFSIRAASTHRFSLFLEIASSCADSAVDEWFAG